MATIQGFVTRHGKKTEEVPDREFGSLRDQRIVLSAAGAEQMRQQGSKLVRPDFYTVLDTTTSPFARTRQSIYEMVVGAGYNPHQMARRERDELGFTVSNWTTAGVPPYDPSQADTYVQVFLRNFWMGPKREDRAPVMAEHAFGLLDSLVTGIERVTPYVQSGENACVMIATHGTIIDMFDAAMYGTVQPQLKGPTVVRNFPGAYATGEAITFELDAMSQGLPFFKVNAKGREKILSLDDLKDFRETAYRNMQGHL